MANCFCLKWRPDIVKALDFRHCNLLFVPEEVFEFGETLEELFLDSNDIRDLPRPLFHCQNLKKLGASDNELFSIPPAIASLINLKELDISKNGIVELPDAIKGCRELDLMEVSVNPLGRLPDGFTQLINLTQLYLNDTLLDYLPANFGRLVKLTVLELRENHLKSLPKSVARLTSLERLDLGQNCFEEVPEILGSLSSLQEFWIDANKVNKIPKSIGSLRKLFYFDASRNRIEELPSTIAGWDGIKDIHLSKNFIQKLPVGIGELSTLSTLRVDNNQLSSLPYSIGGLVSLEELILNANDLEDLPPSIGLLRKLRHLNVDDNMLITLPAELGSCNKISLLSLRGNYLEWLPDEIGRISSLVVANFSNNRLKYLPYNFTKLKNLQALWLSENQSKPLIQLQSEIREESGKRVLTCFLLPQLPPDDIEYDDDGSDSESFHMSVWSQQRRQKMVIAFDVSESEPETVLESKSRKQAYPKETYRPKFRGGPNSQLSNGHVPSGVKREDESPHLRQRDRVRGRRELAEEGSISGSVRSSRPRSPASSTISDTHSLFKADKEKHAKDKARIRKGSLSPSKAEKGSLQVQWELPESHQKESKKRRSNRIIIKERASHSDSEVLDSHPMKVRTPRSERKRRSRQARHMDEADREVAQLTNSLRESSPERENQTDTELFTKKDMPDVVFQQSPYMHSLVTRSASMDFKASPTVISREQLRDRRPNGYLPQKSETPQSTPMQEHRSNNSRVTPSGHTPDASSTSRRMNGNLRHRTGRSLPGTPKSHTGSPGSKRRTLSGPAGRDIATTGVKDYDERKDSLVVPAVQHHVVHQQGRDSGISIPQTPSGYVTDPELERLYQMRYRQDNTPGGRSGGNVSHGENRGQRGSQTRVNLRTSGQMVPQPGRKSNSGYSSDHQGSSEVAMTTGGEESMGGKEGIGRDRVEDVQQRTGNQEWRYNVKTEATSRVNVPRNVDSGKKEVRWQSPHPTSTPGRKNHPSVGGDLSSRSHQRDLNLRDQVLQADASQQGYVKNSPMAKPWDPRQSPSRHRPDTGSASVPASGEYSDQLRRVSGHFLSVAGSFLSHQQERSFSNTPSISYQQPPSMLDQSGGVKGARRHLRFSSENQSLVPGNHQISRLSSSHSGDNRSVNSHPSKTPLPNRTYQSEVMERRDYEDDSTLQEASQRSSSLQNGNNTNISEQTFTEGGGENSNSSGKINGANDLPYKERAVDVPPEFLEMEEKFDRATKLQTEPVSASQLGRLHPSHYSTPYNQTVSSLSSGRPFSSPRSTGASVMSQYNQRNRTERPFTVSQNESTEAGTTAKPQHFNGGGDGLDAGVQWAVPSWVRESDNKPDGHYTTDVNKNRSYGHDWSDPDGMSSSQQQRGREDKRQVNRQGNRNNSNLVQTVEQRDIIPTSSTPRTKKLPTSRDINEQNWRNHLMDHLQKRSGQNPDESDDVFQSSGPSPSPPSYHKAISNNYPMPPYVMRRSLPVPASVSQIGKDGEDVRRVTPPGSSGSSTTGSCPRHLPAPPTPHTVKGTTQYLTHVRREPPPLSTYHPPPPVAQKRTAPDGNRGLWL